MNDINEQQAGEYKKSSNSMKVTISVLRVSKKVSHHNANKILSYLRRSNQVIVLQNVTREQAIRIENGTIIEILYRHVMGYYREGERQKYFSGKTWKFSKFP